MTRAICQGPMSKTHFLKLISIAVAILYVVTTGCVPDISANNHQISVAFRGFYPLRAHWAVHISNNKCLNDEQWQSRTSFNAYFASHWQGRKLRRESSLPGYLERKVKPVEVVWQRGRARLNGEWDCGGGAAQDTKKPADLWKE